MDIGRGLKRFVRREATRRGVNIRFHVAIEKQAELFDAVKPLITNHELIRIGSDHDGGYLVPDDLDGIKACFSPGVDVVAGFEEGMIARGIRCFQVDASVERSPLDHPLVEFEPKFLGIVNDEQTVTLTRWVDEKMPGDAGDFILQMDIEGAEWLALANTDERTLAKFRIILVEFHELQQAFEHFAFDVISAVFDKLLRQFDVVHVHPNNCSGVIVGKDFAVPSVLEYTFLRKDRITRRAPATEFPHPLDQDNKAVSPSIVLPSAFYGSSARGRA